MTGKRVEISGSDDEFALRRFAAGSVTLAAETILRLMKLRWIERHGHGQRLTPLGHRKFRSLSKPALQAPDRGDPIAAVLDKYSTSFQNAQEAAPPRIETRGRPPRHLAEEARISPVIFFDARRSLMEARRRILRLRETMHRQREDDLSRTSSSKACLAVSHAVLATSAGFLRAAERPVPQ